MRDGRSRSSPPAEAAGGARIRARLRGLLDFLGSGRLAVLLLAALVVLVLLALLLPRPGPPASHAPGVGVGAKGPPGATQRLLGLTRIRSSWLLHGTCALLFLNLLLCLVRRSRAALLLWRMPERPPAGTSAWIRRESPATGLDSQEIARLLRRKGYRTLIQGCSVYGLRGRFAIVGHWLLHAGFLVLLAGAAYVAATPAAFRGTVGVGEGEEFDLRHASFLATRGTGTANLPDLRFTLQHIDVALDGDDLRRFDVRLSAPEGGNILLGINRPYRRRPYQVLTRGFGYMPAWAIVDPQGRMVRGAWVKLIPFPLEAEETFSLGPKLSNVRVTFYPDYERQGDEERSRSHELRRPRFRARIVLRGQTVHDGLLHPGQRVALDGGGEFFFLPQIRRYALLDVVHEKGQAVVFTSFGLVIGGLFLRYARVRKEILVEVGSGSLQVLGRSEILENLFAEELERLTADLRDRKIRLTGQEGFA